jgi:Transposase and inactivated derivatives
MEYRRNLPHMQDGPTPLIVSMSTYKRLFLPPPAREIILASILHENEHHIFLDAAVVMPDHAHLLFTIRTDDKGDPFALAAIMNGIRAASAHRVNKLLHRTGHVWEEEFFDRLVRDGQFLGWIDYVLDNPVKAGLAQAWQEYPWLWLSPEWG